MQLQNEQEAAAALLYETERAVRAELGAYRDQIKNVSVDLLAADKEIEQIKNEVKTSFCLFIIILHTRYRQTKIQSKFIFNPYLPRAILYS